MLHSDTNWGVWFEILIINLYFNRLSKSFSKKYIYSGVWKTAQTPQNGLQELEFKYLLIWFKKLNKIFFFTSFYSKEIGSAQSNYKYSETHILNLIQN